MNQIINTIQREAADTAKGFTLQKLRTISIILTELEKNQEIDFIAAIEYNGDVFLENKNFSYTEENKAYDSQNFTFASPAIRNTMVYFLDHWLNHSRDSKIRFGVYTTNQSAKEIKKGLVKDLKIGLPKKKIIESLSKSDFSDKLTLEAAKSIILSEYKTQYQSNKNVSLKTSYYDALCAFQDQDWKDFFKIITWHFDADSIEAHEIAIIEQIKSTTLVSSNQIAYKAPFIRAELFYQLEIRQNKTILNERFLTRDNVELIFHRALANNISENSYKYLSIDYSEIREKTAIYLKDYIDNKYFALSGIKSPPGLLNREVAFFDSSMRLTSKQADRFSSQRPDTISGSFASLIQQDKPTFLFGELGSGKSSIAAGYILGLLNQQDDILPLLIPASYLQQRQLSTLLEVKLAINDFVNIELQLSDPIFDIDVIFKTRKETTLIIDGLDELNIKTARLLISHLKNLKNGNDSLRLIATGRPIELEGIVPSGWHTLFTLPLKESEIKSILTSEAVNRNLSHEDAEADSTKRFSFLKSRPELHSIAITPLIICAIRDSLNDSLGEKTLGDILYETLRRKLEWGNLDNKQDNNHEFHMEYPSAFDKELLLAKIAWHISTSANRSITEVGLNTLLRESMPQASTKPRIISEAVSFFKSAFLQETSNNTLGFTSAPLMECATGLQIAELLKSGEFQPKLSEHWRSFSFALAISRQKGRAIAIEPAVEKIMADHIQWPRAYVIQFAIILAEFKSAKLCQNYFGLLDGLTFRPLRLEGQNDTLSSFSYATCIKLSGDIGFNWLWENYLDPKTPLIHYEGKLAADILSHYLLMEKFQLQTEKINRLAALILPHITFPNSFCFEILPILATVTRQGLNTRQYYQLLAGLLSNQLLGEKAREILLKESIKSKTEVLTALETVSGMRETGHLEAAKLWLELNEGSQIDKKTLSILLRESSPDRFDELFILLGKHIGQDELISFLKYCVLAGNDLSKHAALFLFLAKYRDFKILGPTLINSIDWLDYKNYSVVEEIQAFVALQSSDAIASIAKNIPVQNYLGIPPAFWRIFLPALENAKLFFEDEFLNAINNINLLTLTRYPEIRVAFTNLFQDKIRYKQLLREQLYGLNNKLRYKSAALLLVLAPESEIDALEIVIGGMSSSSDMDEWQTFCLGLNYSQEVLTTLAERSARYIGLPRIYSLILLFRYHIVLNETQEKALLNGLLDEGYFIDREGHGIQVRYHTILSNPEMMDKIVPFLFDENLEKAERAADILFNYHLPAIDPELICRVYLLSTERYERKFFEVTESLKHEELKSILQKNIVDECQDIMTKYGKTPILGVFYEVINNRESFSTLFNLIIQRNGSTIRNEMDSVSQWVFNITRLYPCLIPSINDALAFTLSLPVVSQHDHAIFPWLKLLEHQFDPTADAKSDVMQSINPRVQNEELFVALHARGVYRHTLDTIVLPKPAYYTLFAAHNPQYILQVSDKEIDRYLFDMEEIPNDLAEKLESVLIFGNFSQEELKVIEKKGNLGSYFSAVINFCRGQAVDAEMFSQSKNIGDSGRRNRQANDFYRNILYRIYRSLISEEAYLTKFIQGQLILLSDPNRDDYVDVFAQLLALDHTFTDQEVLDVMGEIYNKPYELRPEFAYNLCNYLIRHIDQNNQAVFVENFKKYLQAFRDLYEREGQESQFNLALWIFSLFLIYLEDSVSEDTRTAFLLGSRYMFVEQNSLQQFLLAKPDYFFAAGDLLKYTYPILEKVHPRHIRSIVDYGLTVNIPVIRATCYLLSTLANAGQ